MHFNGTLPKFDGVFSALAIPKINGMIKIIPYVIAGEIMDEPMSISECSVYFEVKNSSYKNALDDFRTLKKSNDKIILTLSNRK